MSVPEEEALVLHIDGASRGNPGEACATEEVEWANVIAISVVALIPSVAVFFMAQRHFIEGASSSGIKG